MYIEKKVLNYFNENATKGLSMEAQIEAWVEQASKSVLQKSYEEYPETEGNHMVLTFMKGRKYYRIMIQNTNGNHRSAYCFIDMEGNIYKCAGWKKPAKGIRGHISKIPANEVQPSTGWLYRYR